MARICAIVLNSVSRDARVLKEAASLAAAGHDVTVVGVTDTQNRAGEERLSNGVTILRADISDVYTAIRALLYSILALVAALCVLQALWLPAEWQISLPYVAAALALLGVFVVHQGRFLRRATAWLRGPGATSPTPTAHTSTRWSAFEWMRRHVPLVVNLAFLVRTHVIYSIVRKLRPDIVHCHDVHTLGIGALAKRRLRCKVTYDAHEIYEEVAQGNETTRRRHRRIHRRYLRYVDRFVTINDSIADWYARNYPKLPKAVVVMNAAEKAPPFNYDGRLHRAAELDQGAKILLYQGGYAAKRGLDYLVRAAEFLPADWTLVMMGWGNQEAALRQLASEVTARTMHRPAPVRFVPPAPQAELPLWTAGGTVGVIPYENVGLNHWFCTPNKLWEYPNADVPVLVSPFPELRRPVEQYGFGWLLPEEQDPQLLGTLIAGLDDSDIARARTACRAFIEAENWSKYGARLVKLYGALGAPDLRRSASAGP